MSHRLGKNRRWEEVELVAASQKNVRLTDTYAAFTKLILFSVRVFIKAHLQ